MAGDSGPQNGSAPGQESDPRPRSGGDLLDMRMSPAGVEPPSFGAYLRHLRLGAEMKRSELATRSSCGAKYVEKLEQGQSTAPSPQVVDHLADSLHLTEVQRRHLHDLSTYRAASDAGADEAATIGIDLVTDSDRAYVDGFGPAIAGIVDDAWNVIYPNTEYRRVFRHIADKEVGNVLVWFFFVPVSHHIMVEWEREALLTVSWFRALMVRQQRNAPFEKILQRLILSPEFREMWSRNDVALGRHQAEMLLRDIDNGEPITLLAQVMKWPDPTQPLQLYLANRVVREADLG